MDTINIIMKAIQFVGPATDAAHRIYEGFVAITSGAEQDDLKARYAEARQHSDQVHAAVQHDLSA